MAAIASLRRSLKYLALVICFATAAAAQTYPLIGVTGDGGQIVPPPPNPETLFLLNQTNASAIFVMALGNGEDGETIGYNTDNGLLYHSSGRFAGDRFWESIDVLNKTIVSSGQYVGPDVTDNENIAMVFNPATGRFLVANLISDFFDMTLAGVATKIGDTPTIVKGLAFTGGSLYAAANLSDLLYRLNPANGSTISNVGVTLNGNPVTGMNGLATHPGTGALWGIFRVGSMPGVRHLGTVNPTTGVVTSVGILSHNFAGIAFLPEPSPIPALGAGALAVALCAPHRRRKTRS